jgi:thiamine biosynthesis lipoprotein
MGAPWKIVLYSPSEMAANDAAKAAFARIEELNKILSDYDSESELFKLGATTPSPQPIHVSDDLWRVLELSQQLAEKSDGAFDITIGPLTKLWRRARREKEFPKAALIDAARQATDFRALKLDPAKHTAQLMKPNMQLDAGGIGMGYGVDEAFKVLKAKGIESALIDASGDIGVSNAPPGKRGWRIAIEPPVGEGPPSCFVELANAAITTTGDAFQAVELNGKRYSHVIDPRTGLGVEGRAAITVIAPDCTTADSYTKPICVLGPEKGFKIIEATPGAAAIAMRQGDAPDSKIETLETANFKSFVVDSNSTQETAK